MILSQYEYHKLLFEMLRIRRLQSKIEELYLHNEMRTPVHLCIGQEAIAVGVCACLGKRDSIHSNHRGHAHYLAKGGNLKALVAELYGKETGCSRGRGGSMHLVDVSVGHFGSSSIVGGGIPIGTGMGLAISMKKESMVSVVFFGDGAADEGVLYESINFAVLKKLPVIYVLENNQYSVCSHFTVRQAADNIFHAMPQELLFSRIVDGNDVLEVYTTARQAVDRARSGHGPSLVECRTYRVRGHAGCASQDLRGYRTKEEVEEWRIKCPVALYEAKLLEGEFITSAEIQALVAKIDAELEEAFRCAQNDSPPSPNDLLSNLYCE